MYDVLIVGAGPAGSTAAKLLTEKGFRVLLAERNRLPRYKSCSGVLIRKTLELTRRYFGGDVPSSVMCTPAENRGMIFTDDQGREFRFALSGLNVWRAPFDHWLTEQARTCGAEVRDGVSVVSCEEEDGSVCVTLRPAKAALCREQAHYVLNCEGAAGALRQKLTGQSREYITTFQTFHQGSIRLDPHYFYAYLQPELSEYDAWFNVKDEMLVLGVSVKDPDSIDRYHRRFFAYLKANHGLHVEKLQRAEKWLMPRIRPGCPLLYGQGRILFAGEAADLLNPMGEGISAAMESGAAAANAVAGNFHDKTAVLAEYQDRLRPLKTYMERQWNLVASMAEPFSEMRL